VEWNRFTTELQMINRELAGAFRPALLSATRGLGSIRKHLEKLGPEEQDRLMNAGLAVGGLGATHLALKRFAGVGLGTFALNTGRASLGMNPALGRFGPIAALMLAGRLAPEHERDTYGLRETRVNPATGMREYARSEAELKKMLEEERKSSTWLGRRAHNTLGSLGAGTFDLINWTQKQFTGQTFKREEFRAPVTAIEQELERRKGANAQRRRVTPADAGFDQPEAAYERVSNAFAVRQAQVANEKELSLRAVDQKSETDLLGQLVTLVGRLVGIAEQPDPLASPPMPNR
jgi:hypothetical protein